ncbi:hypothetical protein [Pontibacter litorisediminis]|uniref:hypothetical protein n=1 Tax=Pontibacter litorisediminis TaxID=1846260 RepID=UPI0023EC755F|nr:hypothetical protein [Pontibacter litorisediminis]
MKHLLLIFFLFPFCSLACSCDPPPVALEFLKSKYVSYGSVIEKEYTADSLTYTVTLKIDKHFKENKENPQTLTFTEAAEGSITGHYTSCDYSINIGENWLIYAYDYKGKLTFSYYCSNSKSYNSIDDIRQYELEIIEAGNKIDLDKIVFESMTGRLGSLQEYKPPKPKVPLDTLLTHADSELYSSLEDSHFENFIINIDTKGNITITAVHRRHKHFEIKRVYDVSYPAYTPIDSLNTKLQNEIVKAIMKGKLWKPAEFMGRKVNSQVHLQVYFKKNEKPYTSPIY